MTTETSRKTEIARVIEQLEADAAEAIKVGADTAVRIYARIDQLRRREAERIEAESRREISLGL